MMKKLPYLKQQAPIRPLEEVKVKVNDDFKNKQNEYMKLVIIMRIIINICKSTIK